MQDDFLFGKSFLVPSPDLLVRYMIYEKRQTSVCNRVSEYQRVTWEYVFKSFISKKNFKKSTIFFRLLPLSKDQ